MRLASEPPPRAALVREPEPEETSRAAAWVYLVIGFLLGTLFGWASVIVWMAERAEG